MAKQIRREQVIPDDLFGKGIESAKAFREEIILTQAVIDKIGKELELIRSEATALKTALGGKSDNRLQEMQKINTTMEKAIRLHEAEKATIKAKADTEAQLIKLYEKVEADRAKRIANEQKDQAKREAIYNKEIANAEKLKQKLQQQSTAYARVDGWLKKLSAEHRDLAVRQELGGKLTAAEIKRMDTLAGRIQKYDSALKAVDATQGRHQRNVGNYASGFNGLNNSVQQITREFPAFANSMQTGFMAISNNLPIFFDEIKKIKVENQELAATGQPTVSAFKQIGRSIFSVTGILGLAVTALTFLGPKLFDWVSGMFEGTKKTDEAAVALKRFNEESKKSAKFISEEAKEFAVHIAVLKNSNAGSERRSRLITEINKKYGTTLKNLKDEAKFQSQLNIELAKYLQYQTARFQVDKFTNLIQRNLEKQEKLRVETMRKLNVSAKDLQVSENLYKTELELRIEKENEYITNIDDRYNAEKQLNDGLETNTDVLHRYMLQQDDNRAQLEAYNKRVALAIEETEKFGYSTDKSTKELKANETQLKANNTELADYIELMNQLDQFLFEISQQQGEFQLTLMDDAIAGELENIRRQILAGEVESRDTITAMMNERHALALKLADEELAFKNKVVDAEFNKERDADVMALRADRDKLIEEINQSEWSALRKAADRKRVEQNFNREMEKLNDYYAEKEKVRTAQKLKNQEDYNEKVYNIDKTAAEQTKTLNEAVLDDQKELLDKRLSNLDEYYKKERIRRLNSNKSNEQIAREDLEDQESILQEQIQMKKDAGENTTDLELQLAETRRRLREDELKEEKKFYEKIYQFAKKSADQIFDYLIKRSQDKQKILDDEIQASEKQSDYLAQKATQGNLAAEESLKKQQEITNQYRDRRREEEEREAALQEAKKLTEMALNITNNLIQKGEQPLVAAGKGISIAQVLKSIFGKGFFFGTDDTGSKSPVSDEYGKITGFTHENEQVWSKKDREAVDFATRDQLKKAWQFMNSPQMIIGHIPVAKQDNTHSPILKEQLKKLDQMSAKLDKLPNEFFSTEVVDGVLKAVQTKIDGNTVKKKYYNS